VAEVGEKRFLQFYFFFFYFVEGEMTHHKLPVLLLPSHLLPPPVLQLHATLIHLVASMCNATDVRLQFLDALLLGREPVRRLESFHPLQGLLAEISVNHFRPCYFIVIFATAWSDGYRLTDTDAVVSGVEGGKGGGSGGKFLEKAGVVVGGVEDVLLEAGLRLDGGEFLLFHFNSVVKYNCR
jgi:hypothetical protein